MFDHYVPKPPLRCDRCGEALDDLQGKDGPCLLLVWEEGSRSPVGQGSDDPWKVSPADITRAVLPAVFGFYGECSSCHAWHDFTGYAAKGVWHGAVRGTHALDETAVAATPIDRGWRQCSACANAWEEVSKRELASCPTCGALTVLEPASA